MIETQIYFTVYIIVRYKAKFTQNPVEINATTM